MAEYTITNIGANKRLNVYGSNVTTLNNHHQLTLWEKSGTNEQRWFVSSLGNNVYIKSKINLGFGLNVYRDGTNKCDLFPISGNETDAAVNIILVGGRYRIQLANYPDLYLTANGSENGSGVYWSPLVEGSAYQTWAFYEITVPTAHTINSLEQYPEIFNQWNINYPDKIRNYGCCVCCCTNVASYYRKLKNSSANEYSIEELGGYPYYAFSYDTGESYFNNYPDVAFSYSFTSDPNEIFTMLRSEISANRPVLLMMNKYHNTNSSYNTTHWVVAYGYTGLGNSYENILVLDPFVNNAYAERGESRTLQAALTFTDYSASITRLEPTSMKN